MSKHITSAVAAAIVCMTSLAAGSACAAEGNQVRYNIAGSLGGEIFAPPKASGAIAAIAYTLVSVDRLTGNDGNVLTQSIPGGIVPLPAPAPSAMYPSYAANTATVNAGGTLRMTNIGLGYLTSDQYANGRIAMTVVIPQASRSQTVGIAAATPTLNFSPAIDAQTQTALSAGFGSQYQAGLASQAAAETGDTTGLGDIELESAWLYSDERLRLIVGGSLVLPNGKYSTAPGPSIGFGKFYTLRPALQAAYLITPQLAVSGKVTWGLNSPNTDNNLRSGNWVGFESAIGYMTPLGPVGLQAVSVQQYEDDVNNPAGASRFQTNTAGVFFTTKIAPLDAVITVQYSKTLDTHNAKAGSFSQIRLIKLF